MILRSKRNWWSMLFIVHGSMMRQMAPQLLIVTILSIAAVITEGRIWQHKVPLNSMPFTLVGVALALFLGFRNSSAYDRWWEGRKLWGALVNTTRTLTRQALTMTGDAGDQRVFINMVIAFVYAMRDQLRGDPFLRSAELLPPALAAEVDRSRYKPFIILRDMGQWVTDHYNQGRFGEITLTAFDRQLAELSNILGGCERIAATPVPFAYSVMIHRVVYFYVALLPFGLVDSINWMTPAVSILLAYAFIALDMLAGELEMPFNRDENDLALDAISLNIELSLREMAGEPMTTPPLKPTGYVLL